MDLLIIELVCWGGLLFFFWALKDGLGKVENDIESLGILSGAGKTRPSQTGIQYFQPENAREPIGSYRGQPIYQYVVIDGQTYQFDRVFTPDTASCLSEEERCVAPGLVYLASKRPTQPFARI